MGFIFHVNYYLVNYITEGGIYSDGNNYHDKKLIPQSSFRTTKVPTEGSHFLSALFNYNYVILFDHDYELIDNNTDETSEKRV